MPIWRRAVVPGSATAWGHNPAAPQAPLRGACQGDAQSAERGLRLELGLVRVQNRAEARSLAEARIKVARRALESIKQRESRGNGSLYNEVFTYEWSQRLLVAQVDTCEGYTERVAIFEAEQHERGEPFAIDAHMTHVTAFAFEGFGEKAPHVIVADAREHRRLEPEPRAPECDVRRRSAQILCKRRYVFEPRADLLRIQIDGETPEAHDIARAVRRETGDVLFRHE